jgi:uncharacterized protein with PQ loop repeat
MVSSIVIDALGYAGGSIVASSAPLQLYKSYITQKTGDIAWTWILSYITGILLIFVYAILLDLPPVYIPLCLEITSSSLLLMLKIKLDLLGKAEYTKEVSVQTKQPYVVWCV